MTGGHHVEGEVHPSRDLGTGGWYQRKGLSRVALFFPALTVLMLAILQRRTSWLVPVKGVPRAETRIRPPAAGVVPVKVQVAPVLAAMPKNEKAATAPAVAPDNSSTMDALRKARAQAGRLNRRE